MPLNWFKKLYKEIFEYEIDPISRRLNDPLCRCYRKIPVNEVPAILEAISQVYKEAQRIKDERKVHDYDPMSEEEYEKIYKLKKVVISIDDIIKNVDYIVKTTQLFESQVKKGRLKSFNVRYAVYGEFIHLYIRDKALIDAIGQIEYFHSHVIPRNED